MATIRDSIIEAAENLAGHTVSAGPTISDALDALTDVLAGEDVQGAQTIADAFAILGDHLDDNAPSGKITITENGVDIDVARYATADVSVSGGSGGNVDVYFVGPNVNAGTYTIDGVAITLETFEDGEMSGYKATVPVGSWILFTPTGTLTSNSISLYSDYQEFIDDGDVYAYFYYPNDSPIIIPATNGVACFSA